MIITILGSGTSHGIPVVGCSCPVCLSENIKNNRTRSSILVSSENTNILIDTATEFRIQAVREKITSVDAIIYTHSHADHLHGLDDIRPLTYKNAVNVYASVKDYAEIKNRFPYIFNDTVQKGGGKPRLNLIKIEENEIFIQNIKIRPVAVKHGLLDIYGYKINDNAAYITDCSFISENSIKVLKGIKVLIIGALRYREHSTHFNINQALELIKKISPERAYLTHLSHDVDHDILSAELPEGIFPAYDGLKISI
ncbi:MAG: MBL fold metallo-hydrolase [Spirochaetaceae bacterium]|jgi:phosphoribosyl 1,2-cyclic phosphate phosphodiesterase|nr:MBL fold metallo-hydrolase [Spirochaetaceae bacterium]